MVTASELNQGMVVRVEGEVYRILKVENKAAAAKLGGVVKAELANVVSGCLSEVRFRPPERPTHTHEEYGNPENLPPRKRDEAA